MSGCIKTQPEMLLKKLAHITKCKKLISRLEGLQKVTNMRSFKTHTISLKQEFCYRYNL